ncbi:hypothetical protein ACWDA9_27750 [Streptomyces sp. NPDC001193]
MTKSTPVRDLAGRFGRSSSSWGNYLNGSQLIPKQLVARLVESFTVPGPRRETMAVEALKLWNAADSERRVGRSPSGGGDLVRQHQRRDDALQQVIKYQALAANAEKHLAELRPMLAYTQSRLENAELQLKLGNERERTRTERQLGQARERLGRVRVQQERARGRRMTAEEHQEFWMSEVLAAQEEISRLEREAQDLAVIAPTSLEPVRTDTPDDVDDAEFDARLQHITAEGLEDEALIEEDLQPEVPSQLDDADVPPVVQAVQGSVQPVSRVLLDKPDTSQDVPPEAITDRAARPAKRVHWAEAAEAAARQSPEVMRTRRRAWMMARLGLTKGWQDEEEVGRFVRRFFLPIPMFPFAWLIYWMWQSMTGTEPRERSVTLFGQIFLATLMGLPVLYGTLRAATVPKLPARIAAPVMHVTWSVLLILDLLPWSPTNLSSK